MYSFSSAKNFKKIFQKIISRLACPRRSFHKRFKYFVKIKKSPQIDARGSILFLLFVADRPSRETDAVESMQGKLNAHGEILPATRSEKQGQSLFKEIWLTFFIFI